VAQHPEVDITPGKLLRYNPTQHTRSSVYKQVGKDNYHHVMVFIEAYLALLLDSPIDEAKPIEVLRKFHRTLVEQPLRETILRFASIADNIIQTCVMSSEFTLTGEFSEEMRKLPIFREYLTFRRTLDPVVLQYILSFLYFGKKMDYIDENLAPDALRAWLEVEQELGTLQFDSRFTEPLRVIISHWLESFDDTTLLPKHGPGFTAEGFIDPNEKLDNLTLDARDRYVFRSTSFGRCGVDRRSVVSFPDHVGGPKVARWKEVPKYIHVMRSICMEPIERMYLQQEVARWLREALKCSTCRLMVDFNDQEPNRHYAVIGSYNYTVDTIDLSAASDRIHVDLVRKVFPKKVLYYLLGTRSALVDVGFEDSFIEVKKFAPMGSALCFPVQSIIFTAVVVLAHLMRAKSMTLDTLSSEPWFSESDVDWVITQTHTDPEGPIHKLFTPRVFGDDIICDYHVTDDVLSLLEHLGLRVNRTKSFRGGQMLRESCGVYAYDGHDVTPIRFRVPPHRKVLDVKTFASLIDAANRAGDFGYFALQSVYINQLKQKAPEGWKRRVSHAPYLPFTGKREAFGIYSKNVHAAFETRESPNPTDLTKPWFQRTEERKLMLAPIRSDIPESIYMEEYALDQWNRARIRGGSTEDDFSAPRVRPSATKVKLGWTPA